MASAAAQYLSLLDERGNVTSDEVAAHYDLDQGFATRTATRLCRANVIRHNGEQRPTRAGGWAMVFVRGSGTVPRTREHNGKVWYRPQIAARILGWLRDNPGSNAYAVSQGVGLLEQVVRPQLFALWKRGEVTREKIHGLYHYTAA